MKKSLLAILLIVFIAPTNSFAYSFLIEGDPGAQDVYSHSWNADLSYYVETPPPLDLTLSFERSVSSKFMIVSDYNRPTHEVNVEALVFVKVGGFSESVNLDNWHTQYAGLGFGTSDGANDLVFEERREDNYNPIMYYEDLVLSTNTWYYFWASTEVKLENEIGDYHQQSSMRFYSGEELAPTPIPGAVWLLGSGLIGLAGLRRRMSA